MERSTTSISISVEILNDRIKSLEAQTESMRHSVLCSGRGADFEKRNIKL